MKKTKKLIIIGAGEFGEIAYEYFSKDSEYEVISFAVEKRFRKADKLFELPIIDFEDIENMYDPMEYETFVAITYVKLNRERRRLYEICISKGYTCASYISSRAFVWDNVEIGQNTFIFENNTLQYHAKIGNNVILWSGNHIGHRSQIGDHSWITSHDVISGFCKIGESCFIGVNATIGDNVDIADDCILAAGAITVKSLLNKGRVYIGQPAKEGRKTSYEQFGLEEK